MKLLSIIVLPAIILSCANDGIQESQEKTEVIGSWQLFELGYSPGDRYIVEEVPANPAQLIHLNADSSFASNIDGYKLFDKFGIRKEDNDLVLILFPRQGTDESASRSFTMTMSGQRLELRARWCIEGCHEAYRPASSEAQNP